MMFTSSWRRVAARTRWRIVEGRGGDEEKGGEVATLRFLFVVFSFVHFFSFNKEELQRSLRRFLLKIPGRAGGERRAEPGAVGAAAAAATTTTTTILTLIISY